LQTLSKIAERPISSEENSLRFINIIVVTSNVIFIYIHYHLKIKVLQLDHKLSEYENILTSGYYKYCIFEILICGIFYPPYLNNIFSGEMLNLIFVYNFNGLISFIVMLKCYIILRVYSYFSRWTSESANSICAKNKVRGGIHFAIKCELKKRTYTMLTIMMLFSLTILSFALRTFEYGVKDPSNTTSLKGDNDLQSLLSCFWLIIITMTTVGYGDIFPKSHLGRFIGVVACIIGMLIVSLMVVSLAVIVEFTNEEKKAYSLIKKLQADDNVYNKAIRVVISILKLRKLIHKSKTQKENTLSERFILLTALKKEISIFKNDYKIANSYSLPLDEMLKKLESKLKIDIHQLTTNIKKLSNVEKELDKISDKQEYIRGKIENIMERQDKIARYIVELNNDNLKKFIVNSYKRTFNGKQLEEIKESDNIDNINEKGFDDEKNLENIILNSNKTNEIISYKENSKLQKKNYSKIDLINNFNAFKINENENEIQNFREISKGSKIKKSKKEKSSLSHINNGDNKKNEFNNLLLKIDDFNNMIKCNDNSSLNNKNKYSLNSYKNEDNNKAMINSGLEFYNMESKSKYNVNLNNIYYDNDS